tara:strand:- start:6621 stop:7148 length:528 start_codon:yes stop_codon:yes gene_type:complete
MTGAEARGAVIPKTLSGAVAIGEAISLSSDPRSPLERLVAALRGHEYYKDAAVVFQGKITALDRDTSKGWVFGNCSISAMTGSETAELQFQNENLLVSVGSRLRCVVPDLVTIVDLETAHAIPTERLAYGQRVAVVACSAPPLLTTARALEVVGPQCFGLDEQYIPLAELIEDLI